MAAALSAPTLDPTSRIGGSTPASKSASMMPTSAAPLAPPPPRTQARLLAMTMWKLRGASAPTSFDGQAGHTGGVSNAASARRPAAGSGGARLPRRDVRALLVRELVDPAAHRGEVEPGQLGLGLGRHVARPPLH